MTMLKIAGIVAGAWLVLSFAFIGPSQQLPDGANAALTLAGVVVVGVPAYLLVRRVIRQGKRVNR
jgi:hypothetical protein